MQLPLADEVRELRARLNAANAAAAAVNTLSSALVSTRLMAEQLDAQPLLHFDLPATDTLRELAERWPALEDLNAADPTVAPTMAAALAMREAQLTLAIGTLRPLGAEADALADQLHALQHRQEHALKSPEYAALAAELQALDAQRAAAQGQLTAAQHQLVVLTPVTSVLTAFVRQLDDMIAEATTDALAWRAAHLAQSFTEALHQVMDQVKLHGQRPPRVQAPAAPFERPAAELTPLAVDALAAMRTLFGQLERQQLSVEAEIARHQAEVDAAVAHMLERTG